MLKAKHSVCDLLCMQLSGTFLLKSLSFMLNLLISVFFLFLIFYYFHLINLWANWKQINIIDIFSQWMNRKKLRKANKLRPFWECLSLQFVCLFVFLVAWKFYLICGALSYCNINDNNNEYKLLYSMRDNESGNWMAFVLFHLRLSRSNKSK